MTDVWKTKWGARRVRKEPPTIDEALLAAESLTSDFDTKVEIAAALMGMPVDAVRQQAAKRATSQRGRQTLVSGRARAVVVEYKRPRFAQPARPLNRR